MTPAVSIVTATWGRPTTLIDKCLPTVAGQTYPNIEHLVVIDGHDPSITHALSRHGYSAENLDKRVVHLGRNWTGFSADGGIGAVPRLVGSYMARGDYICYLDDDNEITPDHVMSLLAALESTGADLALAGWKDTHHGAVHGMSGNLHVGEVDTSSFMHRAELLKQGSWELNGYEGDHRVVQKWVANGAKYVFTNEISMLLHGHRLGAGD